MSHQTGTIAGTHQRPDGSPITGTVEIIPSVPQIKDSAGHVVFSGRAKTDLVDGTYTVDVPASSDTSLNPHGFTYLVKVNAINAKAFTIPGVYVTGGATVHDDEALNPDPAPVVYAPSVIAALVAAPRIALDTDGVPYVQIGA